MELLGQLEGELQAKDIAIATLKVSRIKSVWKYVFIKQTKILLHHTTFVASYTVLTSTYLL